MTGLRRNNTLMRKKVQEITVKFGNLDSLKARFCGKPCSSLTLKLKIK